MAFPLDVCFHNVLKTDAIQQAVEKHALRFERVHSRILGCRVTIAGPSRHHRHGNPYGVRIDLFLPGREIVVHPQEGAHLSNEDLYVSIRDSFKAATRQLRELKVRRSKGRRKREPPETSKPPEEEDLYGTT